MVSQRPAGAARPAEPRIPPLAPQDQDEQVRELLAQAMVPGTTATNIFTTLVRHPGLFRRWLPFGGKLLAGRLPDRDRELLILRTSWLCGAEYEWGQHAPLARAAGLTESDLERIKLGADHPDWSPFDAALVRAADELHRESHITNGTWAALAAHYDERQLIEVPMLVGQYHLVAFALNSLGVQLEPGVAGFDAADREDGR